MLFNNHSITHYLMLMLANLTDNIVSLTFYENYPLSDFPFQQSLHGGLALQQINPRNDFFWKEENRVELLTPHFLLYPIRQSY